MEVDLQRHVIPINGHKGHVNRFVNTARHQGAGTGEVTDTGLCSRLVTSLSCAGFSRQRCGELCAPNFPQDPSVPGPHAPDPPEQAKHSGSEDRERSLLGELVEDR